MQETLDRRAARLAPRPMIDASAPDLARKAAEVGALLDAITAGELLAEAPRGKRAQLRHDAALVLLAHARDRLRVLESALRGPLN